MLDRVCIICGERHSIYLLTHRGESLYQCLDCELIFRHPPVNLVEKERAVENNQRQSAFQAKNSIADAEVVKRYRQLLDNTSLLDVRLAALSFGGAHPLISLLKAEVHDLEVVNFQNYESLNDDSYDLILLPNVLEAFIDPDEVLKKIHKVLKKDGKIALVFYSLESKSRFGSDENFWSLPSLYYFSHTTMQLLLEKCGYKKIWSATSDLFIAQKSKLSDKQSLSVIMPVYNEIQTFETALNAVLQKKIDGVERYEVVIVDNNSTDGTKELVKSYEGKPGIKIVFADEKQGKGYAVRKGLEQASGDIILIQDADLEYDIDDYDALLEPLLNYKKLFVLGSRHKGKWKMRSFINNQFSATLLNTGQIFFTALLNFFYNQQMTDPLTMYKIFRKECLYGLKLECNGFDFDQELVAKLIRKGYTPHEIRVNYRSRSFSEGKKITMLRDPIMCLICDFKYWIVSPYQAGWEDNPNFDKRI